MASAKHGHTIHMTQEESDRMRQTVQTRLKKCKELHGQPRSPREPKGALSEAKQAGLMADMSGEIQPGMSVYSGRENIVALAVGSPYPPCTTPLSELKPISLAELQLDTHHEGRVLSVKRTGPEVPLVAYSWTVVEDEAGHVERLEVYLHKAKRGENMLESTRNLKIKEPYFTINEQGEATIRVQHPSDIVRISSTELAKTAEKCKIRGNAALKRQEFVEAAEHYAEGARLCEGNAAAEEAFNYDLHRNRAHVNIILNRWDEAKADGLAAITGRTDDKSKSLDSKANFRAGSAAYALGQFEEAQKLFEAALKLAPEDKEAKIYLRNIETRLSEQSTGQYDLAKIRSRISPAKSRVDAATFTANTVFRDSPIGGRGLFTTRDIKAGEIVLCEKAFCVVWSHEAEAWSAMTYDARDDKIRVFPAGMTKVLVQKLLNNPSQISKVMDLFGDHKSIGSQVIETEDGPVVDTFQIHDIVCRNAFGPGAISNGGNYGEEDVRTASTGLWITAAYVNHSCLSNAHKEYVGDLMILRATKDIKEGEEITHTYSEVADYDARAAALMTTWGFECQCKLCEAERQDGKELRDKRQELAGEAAAFMERENSPKTAKRLSVAKAEKIAKSLNETYDEKRYEGLPRTMLGPLVEWLEQAKGKKQ
ncbi:Putative SET domain, tetratricopeptide-like helical domain superfamily [Septoria linicola]|uniref:SET domain, tetratricopeptide-like helical domain superfamily n=1 Tax=Septoria linicola TaxID=215465 RepID=A0A9Q9EPL3_9PEZI|nr:Putative SET domain, tetratricopeptide-like helical domain superfamily [Septoria linicola]